MAHKSSTKEHPPETSDTKLQQALGNWLIEESPVFMLELGHDGRILLINKALLQVIGRTKEEVAGKEYFTGIIPESDHDALTRLFGTVGPSPKTIMLETHLIAADGQLRLIEWHGRAVFYSERLGKIICCVGTDITERRSNSEELLQTRDYLENVLENSPDAIGIVDPKGRFIKWNHTAVELYGYSNEEFRGEYAFNWYADKDELAAMVAVLRKQGFVKNYEISMKKKDGTIIPFDVSISLLKDKNGSLLGSVSVARNLSETKKALHAIETANSKLQEEMEKRQQASEALEKSQSEYRTIFENTGNATVIIGEDSTIFLANAEFARISGYAKEEIEGKKSLTEFFSDEHQALMKEYRRLRRIDPHAAPRNYEASFKNIQGHSRDMFLTVAVIPGSQKTVASLLDITERKQAELELRKSHEELEQRSYEISLLNEMLNLLQVCGTGEESYYVLGNYIQKLFPSDSGFLYLLKDAKTTLEVVFSWGDSLTSEKVFDYDHCWALRQGKVHMVEEPGGVVCRHLKGEPTNGYLCVPMIAQGEIIGFFHLRCGPSDIEEFPETRRKIMFLKQRLAVAITDHIGLALANLNMRETLRVQSIRDPLTGLFNRRFMEESLTRELSRAKRHTTALAIIMMDLDHFKNFNDTQGHEAGDLLLAATGGILKKSVRSEDVVCRYGGEEFLIILCGASGKDALDRAEYIRNQIKEIKLMYHGKQLPAVTASLGVAVFDEHNNTAPDILNAADKALYSAKNQGRDRVVMA